ncbi:hypothetical protein HDU91_005940 [Kappamyces sp. JEL0680]|nr:hypothetical protein HDU91_005940 [Kappamyces sp. JEL0680]
MTENSSTETLDAAALATSPAAARGNSCPFAVFVFLHKGAINTAAEKASDYQDRKGLLENGTGMELWSWKSTSLEELSLVLAELKPELITQTSKLNFRAIHVDKLLAQGKVVSSDLGSVDCRRVASAAFPSLGFAEKKTFTIGDILVVEILEKEDILKEKLRGASMRSDLRSALSSTSRFAPYDAKSRPGAGNRK